jgi:hypothetical protein
MQSWQRRQRIHRYFVPGLRQSLLPRCARQHLIQVSPAIIRLLLFPRHRPQKPLVVSVSMLLCTENAHLP